MASVQRSSAGYTDHSTGYDVIVVGAGFAGLYMLYRLRELGFSTRVFEAADDVGGVWYWNRYPGARCDSESYYYCYTFSKELLQEWHWSERYASQPEILRYLNYVADRFDLRRDIQFNTRVTSAVFNEESRKWEILTNDGRSVSAPFFITAMGTLSAANLPNYEGLDTFRGKWFHTSKWPHETIDFTGQRVGVIGTGATGIQCIPEISKQAAHLTVFQRTPNFATPARNHPTIQEEERQIKAHYDEIAQKMRNSHAGFPYRIVGGKHALEVSPIERNRIYEELWEQGSLRFLYSFGDILYNSEANQTVAEFIRCKIREIIHDPEVAELLCPKEYPYGTKRPPLESGYYETFNQENVRLVDIKKTPIGKITPTGIQTSEAEYELDSIIFATGFDAITGALFKVDIRGPEMTLKQKWEEGPHTYLGIAVHGFPNMFMITGPGSPSVLSNEPVTIEQGVDWISQCLLYLRDHEISRIEPTLEAEEAWGSEVNKETNATLYPLAHSWYSGMNISGKPKVFMPYIGGLRKFRDICDNVAAKGYEGFTLTGTKYGY